MKGYTHRMGRVVTTMEAHLRVCEVGACCTSSMVTPISSSAAVAEMMMVRIPFGVPAWEVVVSALLLVAAFLAVTWMAAKIYRIGLLSYGNKPTYKDLWRWIRMN